MLVRVSGGSSGIAEYLEEGIKNGRDYTRDELDDRLILDGNLAATDLVIKGMDTNAERYLHITLAFKEDYIPQETLSDITQEFKAFSMKAYREDEYNFYAEAHIPKIKTIIDKESGEKVDRKPHIHIVIPKTNIETGKRLDPFEVVEHNQRYIDAFQEVMNEKHGLASPKIHIRTDFTSESSVIARNKGDIFKGANKALKAEILKTVLEQPVHSMADLAQQLRHTGYDVKVRNAGKDSAYLNIRPEGKSKGINLKDTVFTDRFLSLPGEHKQSLMNEKQQTVYIAPNTDKYRATPQAHARLEHWQEHRSYEVRHITRRNRAGYKAMSKPEQVAFIQAKKQEHAHGRRESPGHLGDNLRAVEDNVRAADRYLLGAQRNSRRIEPGGRRIANRRVVRAFCTTVQGRPEHQKPVRAIRPQYRRLDAGRSDEITDRIRAQQEKQNRGDADIQIAHIKKTLAAKPLLESLSQSHGLTPGKYPVTQATDGTDRIRCGERNLNVADFLTKEMSMSWHDARQCLEREHARQNGRTFSSVSRHDRELFDRRWQPSQRQARQRAWKQQLDLEKTIRNAHRQALRHEKRAIRSDNTISRAERNTALSIAQMNKVIADMQFAKQQEVARAALHAAYPNNTMAQYQQFERRHTLTESEMMTTATGTIEEHGRAPYQHIAENQQSYYVRLKQPDGQERTVWGKGLEKALGDGNFKTGDTVRLETTDAKPVEVPVKTQDKDGKIISETIQTERMVWNAEPVPIAEPVPPKTTAPNNEPPVKKENVPVTRKTLDESLEAARLLVHYPQLKELGIKPDHVTQTPKGDRIKYNDKSLTVTQLIKETQGLTPKQTVNELSPLYLAQEKDRQRVHEYKERYMNDKIETINNDQPLNSPGIKINSRDHESDIEKNRKPLPPQKYYNVTHKTNDKGHISYFLDKDKIVVDRGKDVFVTNNSDKAVEIGLRLSIEKFGPHLDVNGSQQYKEQIANIAAKNNLNVTFTDPKMNELYKDAQKQLKVGSAIIKKAEHKVSRSEPAVQNNRDTRHQNKQHNQDRDI